MRRELLIFGASGALGKGVTKTLLQKGYDKVYLFGREGFEGPQVPDVVNITVKDLSAEENAAEAFSNITPSKDTLFFLFSAVGGFAGGKKIWEQGTDVWEKMYNINVKSSFNIAKHFSLLVKQSAGGSILFTGAFTGLNPESGKGAYGSAKSALMHLTRTLSIEGKEINLSANALAPYLIDTPENREWAENIDFETWQKPEEIGGFVDSIFRCHNFINGNIIKLTERFKA